MSPAPSALDLHPFAVRVGKPPDRPWDLLVEGGPSAVRFELVVRTVQRCPTALALVDPRLEVVFILPGERWLGTFVENNPLLGARERAKRGWVGVGHARADLALSYNVMAREKSKGGPVFRAVGNPPPEANRPTVK